MGVFFITQSPRDIPDGVLAQLGTRIQHALHAYTPTEQKAAKAAAQSFRENPEFDTYEVLTSLGIGEALVSVLDEDGVPTVVEQTKILPPQSRMGTIDESERESEIKGCLLYNRYNDAIDRDSAYEFLQRKQLADEEEARAAAEEQARLKEEEAAEKQRLKEEEAAKKAAEREAAREEAARRKEEEAAKRSAAAAGEPGGGA